MSLPEQITIGIAGQTGVYIPQASAPTAPPTDPNAVTNATPIDLRSSENRTYRNLRIGDGAYGVELIDCGNVLVDGLQIPDSPSRVYGVYVGQYKTGNHGITIRNTTIDVASSQGEHCIRTYAADGLSILNCLLSNTGKYGGQTLNIRQGRRVLIDGGASRGHGAVFGPNLAAIGEDDYFAEFLWSNYVISADEPVFFYPQCRGTVIGVTFQGTGSNLISVYGPSKAREKQKDGTYIESDVTRAAADVEFINCNFIGKCPVLGPGSITPKFTNCAYNGKAI